MALLTPYWGLDGIVVFLSLMVTAYLYMTRKFKYWNKRGILEITPTPFIGNISDLLLQRKSPGEFIKGLYDYAKDQPYMGFYIFDKPCFLVRDRELVKNVLVKNFNYFSSRYESADVYNGLGYAYLFTMKNPDWRTLKETLTPVFTSGNLKTMFDVITEFGFDLGRHLESLHLESANEVEVKDLCAKFTTDLMRSRAFDSGGSVKDLREFGHMSVDQLFRNVELSSAFFMAHCMRPMGSKFFRKDSRKFLRNVVRETINLKLTINIPAHDFIDILIKLKKNREHEGGVVDFGLRVGLLQLKVGLIHMLKEYEFLRNRRTVSTMLFDSRDLTTQAKGGIYLAVRKLNNETG